MLPEEEDGQKNTNGKWRIEGNQFFQSVAIEPGKTDKTTILLLKFFLLLRNCIYLLILLWDFMFGATLTFDTCCVFGIYVLCFFEISTAPECACLGRSNVRMGGRACRSQRN